MPVWYSGKDIIESWLYASKFGGAISRMSEIKRFKASKLGYFKRYRMWREMKEKKKSRFNDQWNNGRFIKIYGDL